MNQNVMPELSVVIPAYNASKTIIKTLSSLMEQTVDSASYEIIVVDDGSADDTYDICCKFAAEHPNVHVVHKENGGVSTARNEGISRANGRWVSFVDSDDLVTNHYVEVMCNTAPDADYVIFDHIREINGTCTQGKVWLKPWFDSDVEKADALRWVCDIRLNAPWDKRFSLQVIRAHAIQFPEGVHTSEDYLFNFLYAWQSMSFYVSGAAVYRYIDNAQSLTHKKVGLTKLREYEKIYSLITKVSGVEDYLPIVNGAFRRIIAIYAGRLHRSKHSKQTITELFEQSVMVKKVLEEPTVSIKDAVRRLLLRFHLYGLCNRLFQI